MRFMSASSRDPITVTQAVRAPKNSRAVYDRLALQGVNDNREARTRIVAAGWPSSVVEDRQVELLEAGGIGDHVHLDDLPLRELERDHPRA